MIRVTRKAGTRCLVRVALVSVVLAAAPTASRAQQADTQADQDDEPRTPIPPLTDDDRAAAFPDIDVHAPHGNSIHAFLLFDEIEWQTTEHNALHWETDAWIGGDRNRLWIRTDGTGDNREQGAVAQVLYGRAFARWWDVVAGVRQDIGAGPTQTWAAFGVQGLAAYWFELEATGYLSEGGQTAARFEVGYELLVTNRLVVQPRFETNLYGKANAAQRIGAGISNLEFGLRVRYEVRRELAPYVGVMWNNLLGATAEFAETAGEQLDGPRLVAGVRVWF